MTRADARRRRGHRPVLGLIHAVVVQATAVTPRTRRITLGGEGLRSFLGDRPADAVKLILPADGRGPVPAAVWGPGGLVFEKDYPGAALRAYTVRRFDRRALRLDIEVVIRGDGPGAIWASQASPGDSVSFIGPRRDFPDAGDDAADLWLIAGDEAAISAAFGIVESLPVGRRAQVFLEVDDRSDEQPIDTIGDVTISWLHRRGLRPAPSLLETAISAFRVPPGKIRAWVAAETSTALALRRFLRGDLGLPRTAVTTFGYWQRNCQAGRVDVLPDE